MRWKCRCSKMTRTPWNSKKRLKKWGLLKSSISCDQRKWLMKFNCRGILNWFLCELNKLSERSFFNVRLTFDSLIFSHFWFCINGASTKFNQKTLAYLSVDKLWGTKFDKFKIQFSHEIGWFPTLQPPKIKHQKSKRDTKHSKTFTIRVFF